MIAVDSTRSSADSTWLTTTGESAGRHGVCSATERRNQDEKSATPLLLQPFPEALQAEVAMRQHDPNHATALLDHAFGLGCRLGDPCWEAMAARAKGLVLEAAGERVSALASLREAAVRVVRVADPYLWVYAYCLDALTGVEIAAVAPDAHELVAQLERVAARSDMRELVVRAALHRARLGDHDGVPAARLLAEAIDNPALDAELRPPSDHTRGHTARW
jgi:hypothetical protein